MKHNLLKKNKQKSANQMLHNGCKMRQEYLKKIVATTKKYKNER